MQALHGGKATNDTIDSPKMAALLRGGRLPQASGSPVEMRAPRALFRRRLPRRRKRAALLAHVHNSPSPYPRPEISKTIASKAQRDGVAERFPAPAVHKSLAVALALIGY
jgi:hypothetical protein